MIPRAGVPGLIGPVLAVVLLLTLAAPSSLGLTERHGVGSVPPSTPAATTPTPVANFTAALQRMVSLLALSGSGLLAIVWVRVALSWFSNDIAKKVQAKDRARDALIGTAIFVAAVSGLLWGVAHWVVTGT